MPQSTATAVADAATAPPSPGSSGRVVSGLGTPPSPFRRNHREAHPNSILTHKSSNRQYGSFPKCTHLPVLPRPGELAHVPCSAGACMLNVDLPGKILRDTASALHPPLFSHWSGRFDASASAILADYSVPSWSRPVAKSIEMQPTNNLASQEPQANDPHLPIPS